MATTTAPASQNSFDGQPHNRPATPISASQTPVDDSRANESWRLSPSTTTQRLQQASPTHQSPPIKRRPVSSAILPQPEFRLQNTPASPVSISPPRMDLQHPESAAFARIATSRFMESHDSRRSSGNTDTPDLSSPRSLDLQGSLPIRSRPSSAQSNSNENRSGHHRSHSSLTHGPRIVEHDDEYDESPSSEGLHYHAFDDAPKQPTIKRVSQGTSKSVASSSSGGDPRRSPTQLTSQQLGVPRTTIARPASAYTLGDHRGRALSPLSANGSDPGSGSPNSFARDLSANRRSPSVRPVSYIDLLNNVPYNQQVAPAPPMNNMSLQSHVGRGASLLDTKKTLEMYRANVKKTQDYAVQYEFAIFMINTAAEVQPEDGIDPAELQKEAKHILQRLADRTYPFASYYLADGYFSGLFNKGKPDYDRAFGLFISASKHGHAEASYRAALCYEFGWGTAKSYPKAVQYYRTAASKNHPGAATRLGLACIRGDMGLVGKGLAHYKDGVKWLKRAQESADQQYNAGPYELGKMHVHGDNKDIFQDHQYAAKLFTQSAELGHPEANYIMGRAYELGELGCPKDAALSVHFYTGAATRGHLDGMMALCAWYMVGAEPVMEKDEGEAYEWAKRAAHGGNVKAQYALGYFTEMGIGCRRDPLEANVWYVRAADAGYENARQRLEVIRAAAAGGVDPSGSGPTQMSKGAARSKDLQGKDKDGKKKFMGIF